MNGQQHYEEAERLLAEAHKCSWIGDRVRNLLLAARVHAALALCWAAPRPDDDD